MWVLKVTSVEHYENKSLWNLDVAYMRQNGDYQNLLSVTGYEDGDQNPANTVSVFGFLEMRLFLDRASTLTSQERLCHVVIWFGS